MPGARTQITMPAGAALEDPAEKWLSQWRDLDFSWTGLALADWSGGPDDEAAIKCWRAPVDFPSDLPVVYQGEEAYKEASLQDYWRWSFGFEGLVSGMDADAPARLLTDEELIEAGLLVEWDNRLWHIIHRPETNLANTFGQEGTGTPALLSVLSLRLNSAGPSQSGADTRVQLVGTRAKKIDALWTSSAASEPRSIPSEIFVRVAGSDFDNCNAASITFGDGVTFERSRFNAVTDFNNAAFKGDARFDRSIFGELTDFFSVTFEGAVSFSRAVFGAETLFRGSQFGPKAAFRHARFGDMADFGATKFAGYADFRGCHFGEETSFNSADLGPEAEFKRTLFGSQVTFSFASLPGAIMEGGKVGEIFGAEANFESANLSRARLRNIDFRETNTRWSGATLDDAEFASIRYDQRLLRGNCEGLKGGASIWGDALLRRDLQDQDYIDTLDSRMVSRKPEWIGKPRRGETNSKRGVRIARNLINMCNPNVPLNIWLTMLISAAIGGILASAVVDQGFANWISSILGQGAKTGSSGGSNLLQVLRAASVGALTTIALALFISSWYGRRAIFNLWGLLGYGRDWDRVALLALFLIAIFGFIYQGTVGSHIAFSSEPLPCQTVECTADSAQYHWFMPWFVAVMGFATLGVADVAEPLTGLGQLIMITNVLAGFSIFGLLLAVLGNRFARRS